MGGVSALLALCWLSVALCQSSDAKKGFGRACSKKCDCAGELQCIQKQICKCGLVQKCTDTFIKPQWATHNTSVELTGFRGDIGKIGLVKVCWKRLSSDPDDTCGQLNEESPDYFEPGGPFYYTLHLNVTLEEFQGERNFAMTGVGSIPPARPQNITEKDYKNGTLDVTWIQRGTASVSGCNLTSADGNDVAADAGFTTITNNKGRCRWSGLKSQQLYTKVTIVVKNSGGVENRASSRLDYKFDLRRPNKPHNITKTDYKNGTLDVTWTQEGTANVSKCLLTADNRGRVPADTDSTTITNNKGMCRWSGLKPLQRYTKVSIVVESAHSLPMGAYSSLDYVFVPPIVRNLTVQQAGATSVSITVTELDDVGYNVTVGFYEMRVSSYTSDINTTHPRCVAVHRSPGCVLPEQLRDCEEKPISTAVTPLTTAPTTTAPPPTTTPTTAAPPSSASKKGAEDDNHHTPEPPSSFPTKPVSTDKDSNQEPTTAETTIASSSHASEIWTAATATAGPVDSRTTLKTPSTTVLDASSKNPAEHPVEKSSPKTTRGPVPNARRKRNSSNQRGQRDERVSSPLPSVGGEELLVVLDGLLPFTSYQLELTPWFCNTSISGDTHQLGNVTTLLQPNITNVEATGSNIHVEWYSPRPPLDVHFSVDVTDMVTSDDNSECKSKTNRTTPLCSRTGVNKGEPFGYCNNTTPLAFWEYNVTVKASTALGDSTSLPRNVVSRPTVPGGPPQASLKEQFWKTGDDPLTCGDRVVDTRDVVCVTWRDACPRDRKNFIKFYEFNLTGEVEGKKSQRSELVATNFSMSDAEYRRDTQVQWRHLALQVTPDGSYQLAVKAVSRDGLRSKDAAWLKFMAPHVPAPTRPDQTTIDNLVPEEELESTENSISFKMENTHFLFMDDSGRLSAHGMIVTRGGDTPIDLPNSKDYEAYPGWADREEALKKGGYRINERALDNDTDHGVTFIVGNEQCSENGTEPDNKYCDGPLDAGDTYSIWVYVCNEKTCINVVVVKNQTTKEGADSKVPLAKGQTIGIAVSFTIFIIAAIFTCWYCCFRSSKSQSKDVELSEWKTIQNIKGPLPNRPMKLVMLETVISKKQRDDCMLLRDEFEDIVQGHQDQNGRPKHRPHQTGRMELNRSKNRYNDIVTYDHSRVKLSQDKEGSDYINANFVPGYSRDKEYIATQGPLPFTTSDFWRMVWEHRAPVIVMLTQPKENGKLKCEQYWPAIQGEMLEYDDIQVTNCSISTVNDYNITIFSITNIKQKKPETREVVHFHYLKWQDMTAQLSVQSLLEFLTVIRERVRPDRPGPMVVHCSAGVGRTGTFICVDYIKQFIDEHSMKDELDIYGFVMRMRQYRCNMVQVEDQYFFVHQCARVLMSTRRKKESELGGLRHSYAPSTSSILFDSAKGDSQETLNVLDVSSDDGLDVPRGSRLSVGAASSQASPGSYRRVPRQKSRVEFAEGTMDGSYSAASSTEHLCVRPWTPA